MPNLRLPDLLRRAADRIEGDPQATFLAAFNPPVGEPVDLPLFVRTVKTVAKLMGGLPVDVPLGSSPAVVAALRRQAEREPHLSRDSQTHREEQT